MSVSKGERVTALDNVKWILTLLIVLYHITYLGDSGVEESVFYFIKNLGDCVVPAFAIISGFLFWRGINNISDVRNKCRRRVWTLLLPYVLWNLINTIGLNILNCKGIKEEVFDINLWSQIVKWNSSPHFWYIFMLIFWTVLAPVLFYSYKDKRFLVLLLLSQILYLVYKGDGVYHSRFVYILYTWGGFVGYRFPNIHNELICLKRGKKIFFSIFSAILYIFLCIVIALVDIQMGTKVWLYALKAVSLIAFTINLPPLRIGKMTNYKYSFWIFSVHYWLDHYLGIYSSRYFGGLLNQWIVFGLVLVLALSSGIVLDRLCPRFFSILNGSRNNTIKNGV